MTTAITLILTQWVDLGNPCDQVVAEISDLKILVIDNIFVLGKMLELRIRINAGDSSISIRYGPSDNLGFDHQKRCSARSRIMF